MQRLLKEANLGNINKGRCWYLFILFLSLSVILPNLIFAGAGLSTSWGEVVINKLQIGQAYSTKKESNMLFSLTNTDSRETRVKVDVMPPTGKIKEGYEAIPDTSWVSLDKDYFIIKPGETVTTDVKISVPDNERYLGKKYQVYIFSYTIEVKGFVGVGLKSRLLLEISAVETLTPEQALAKRKANLRLKLQPNEIHLTNVNVGKKYNIEKLIDKTFELVNQTDKKYTYQIKSIKVEESRFKSHPDYEDCPDPAFLMFKKDEIRVPAKSSRKVKAYIKFPKEEEYMGKKYMFVVYTEIVGDKQTKGIYNRLYITTNK